MEAPPPPPPLPLALLVERGIETLMRLDPDTRARLGALDGRVVRVRTNRPALELVLAIVDGRVDVLRGFDGAADVTISGAPKDLLSLREGNAALYGGRVRIEGDVGVAQGLRDLLGGLHIDPEELAEPFLGGMLARRVVRTGRDAAAWLGRTGASLRADTEEYLKEESELLAPAEEVRRLGEGVDELRAAADRLAARVARLERAATRDEET